MENHVKLDPVEHLDYIRRMYMEAEAELESVTQRRDAWKQILQGAEGLAGAPMKLPDTTMRQSDNGGNGGHSKAPRGAEAIRRILLETRRPWRVQALMGELEQRGWIDPDVQQPDRAVHAAIQRLVKKYGEVERVGHATYQYRRELLPPEDDQSGGNTTGSESAPFASK